MKFINSTKALKPFYDAFTSFDGQQNFFSHTFIIDMSNMFDNWSCRTSNGTRVFTSTQTQLLFVLGGKNPFDCIPRICWTCDTFVVTLSIFTLMIALGTI